MEADERHYFDLQTDFLIVANTSVEEDNGFQTHFLRVANISVEEDTGFYTCFAWNSAGIDQETVFVEVFRSNDDSMVSGRD